MVDKDLFSIQEARALVRAARKAQQEFASLSQEKVDSVVKAVAEAAMAQAEVLAALAVEETGFGKVPDKKIKNILASEKLLEAIKGMKTIGILNDDKNKRLIEIAVPVGVIAGIIPSTNPTSTGIYKPFTSLTAGSAVGTTPPPRWTTCTAPTASLL